MFRNVNNAVTSPSVAAKATSKTSTAGSTATVAVAPALEGGYTSNAVTSGNKTDVAVSFVIKGIPTTAPSVKSYYQCNWYSIHCFWCSIGAVIILPPYVQATSETHANSLNTATGVLGAEVIISASLQTTSETPITGATLNSPGIGAATGGGVHPSVTDALFYFLLLPKQLWNLLLLIIQLLLPSILV
jgi:hypothetical protein